jgi:hypothetical protein
MYGVCSILNNWKFPSEAHQEQRATDCQNRKPVPGDIADCCSVSEIRTYCYLELAAVISKPNRWISRYKFPQPLLILICSYVICWLLGSYTVYQTPQHYTLEGHDLNTDDPKNLKPPSLSMFVLQEISQRETPVWCSPV